MPKLNDVCRYVRSKNAGPFWVTIDIFCDRPEVYDQVCAGLSNAEVAALYQVPESVKIEYVVLDLDSVKKNLSVSEQELKNFVKERLAPYKYPRFIEFVEELPKTATGKIQRFRLREKEAKHA